MTAGPLRKDEMAGPLIRVPLQDVQYQVMRQVTGDTMKKSGAHGFTLIELMIAVIIIGIIAGIAYPSYVKFITESRRSDATTNLLRIAALQTRFSYSCTPVKYAADFGAANSCAGTGTINAGLGAGGLTPDGHYTIAITPMAVADGGTNDLATSFTLTATPAGAQATNDGAKCATFVIHSTGRKAATGTDAAICWKK